MGEELGRVWLCLTGQVGDSRVSDLFDPQSPSAPSKIPSAIAVHNRDKMSVHDDCIAFESGQNSPYDWEKGEAGITGSGRILIQPWSTLMQPGHVLRY